MAAAAAKRKRNAIVASARPVPLDDGKAAKKIIGRRQDWQEEAWNYFDEVAEVKFANLYLGNGMSKVQFFAATQLDDGAIVPITDEASPIASSPLAKLADQEMTRLRSLLGGQSELNKQAAINWSVCGEFFIHGIEAKDPVGIAGTDGYEPPEPEQWEVRSISEVETSSSGEVVKVKAAPDQQARELNPETETLIRMWTRHARWSGLADCHMRALLGDCEALTLMVNQQKAEARSRQAAGLLLVPSELSFTEDDAGGDAVEQSDQNPFIAGLLRALTEPIEDPTSAAAVMPLVVSGPAEYLSPDRFRLLSFARTPDATLDARIEAKIDRIARGLNVPVEVVMGHMSTTFSNAEQIDEDTFTDYFEPMCMALADAYASGFLRPQLVESGQFDEAELSAVTVWFDASALVRGPSVTDAADELRDRGAIGDDAYRRYKGADDSDTPDDIEWLRWLASTKGTIDGPLTEALLKAAGLPLGDVERPQPEPFGAPAAVEAAANPQGLGRRLYLIDRDLRTKLLAAAEAAMARALERAGARLRSQSKSLTAALRLVPAYRACAHIGPSMIAAAGVSEDDLLAGAWDELEVQFKLWSRDAVEATLEVLRGSALGFSEPELEDRRVRLYDNIDSAWVWFAAAMDARAKEVLYAPERAGITAAAGDEALGATRWHVIKAEVDSGALTEAEADAYSADVTRAMAQGHDPMTLAEWKYAHGIKRKAATVSLPGAEGEVDVNARVKPGVVREAVAKAGGAAGVGGEAGIVTPMGKRPVGGIATGEEIQAALDGRGAPVEAYVWVYGPAARQKFEPHYRLDGRVFGNFDDEKLRNTHRYPATPYYYPGDHDGCQCDAEPIIASETTEYEVYRRKRLDEERREYFEWAEKQGLEPHGDIKSISEGKTWHAKEIAERARITAEEAARGKPSVLKYDPNQATPHYSLSQMRGRLDAMADMPQEQAIGKSGYSITPGSLRYAVDAVQDRADSLRRAYSPAQLKELRDNVASVTREARPVINTPRDAFEQVLRDGRWKSQHETHTSRGYLGPSYREDMEDFWQGVDRATPMDRRPIYGFMDSPRAPGTAADNYGDVKAVLKNSVKDKATLTWTDSLGDGIIPQNWSQVAAGQVDVDDLLAMDAGYGTAAKLATGSHHGYGYIEAQYHGLSVGDIDHVVLRRGLSASPTYDGIKAALTERGIPFYELDDYEWASRWTSTAAYRAVGGAP